MCGASRPTEYRNQTILQHKSNSWPGCRLTVALAMCCLPQANFLGCVCYNDTRSHMALSEKDRGKPMQEILNSLPLKDAALFYARNGWPVFPLAGKVPY